MRIPAQAIGLYGPKSMKICCAVEAEIERERLVRASAQTAAARGLPVIGFAFAKHDGAMGFPWRGVAVWSARHPVRELQPRAYDTKPLGRGAAQDPGNERMKLNVKPHIILRQCYVNFHRPGAGTRRLRRHWHVPKATRRDQGPSISISGFLKTRATKKNESETACFLPRTFVVVQRTLF